MSNDISKNITSDELLKELNETILQIKIDAIVKKMYEYKAVIDMTTVDIPEFCKPKEEQFNTLVKNRIIEMINNNTLDFFYTSTKKRP